MLKDSIKIILIINYKYCKFIKKLKKKFLFNYIILKFLFNFIILKFLFNFIYLIKKIVKSFLNNYYIIFILL